MESRHLKDFTIAVLVIVLFAFAVKAYNVVKKEGVVPLDSKYKNMGLSDDLISQIHQIEESIEERKDFRFTVTRDPLEQNLIVKTKVDLEQEWRSKVESMMRLAGTFIDANGNNKAQISYQGNTRAYGIGDYISGHKIEAIESGKVTLMRRGEKTVLSLKPIPPKPAKIDSGSKTKEYIW